MSTVMKEEVNNTIGAQSGVLSPQPLLLAQYINQKSNMPYGPISTVPNEIIFVKKTVASRLEECSTNSSFTYELKTKLTPIASNTVGGLHNLQRNFELGTDFSKPQNCNEQDASIEVYSPPLDALSLIYAGRGENWVEPMSEVLKQFSAQKFEWKKVLFEKLRLPLNKDNIEKISNKSLREEELLYKKWHELQTTNSIKTVQGLYFNKVRAVIITFSSELFLNLEVKIWRHGGDVTKARSETIQKNTNNLNIYSVVFYGSPTELPAGLYNIQISKVPVGNSENRWSSSVIANGVANYTLKEKFRFNFITLAGEYELVNGDPITLEESVIQQFPVHYKALVEQATNLNNLHLKTPSADENRKKMTGLEFYANKINMVKGQSELVAGILGADDHGKLSWAVSSMVDQFLPANSLVAQTTDLVFKGRDLVGAIDGYKDAKLFNQLVNTENLNAADDKTLQGLLGKAEDWVDDTGKSTYPKTVASKLKIPKTFMRTLKRVTGPLGNVLDVYALGVSVQEFAKAKDTEAQNLVFMTEVAADYHLQLHEDVIKDAVFENGVCTKKIGFFDEVGQLVSQKLDIEKGIQTSYRINFDVDKSTIKPEFEAKLQASIEFLKKYPDSVAVLDAHTDTSHTEAYNFSLSHRRGFAVLNKLVSLGADKKQITIHAMGETHPIIEAGSENKAKSRRVDIILNSKMRTLEYAPCREAINNFEKIRSRTIADKLGMTDKILAMLDKASDIAAGGLMVTPIPGARIAGAVVILVKVGVSTAVSVGRWVDDHILGKYFSTLWYEHKLLDGILDSSAINQKLMRQLIDEPEKEIIPDKTIEIENNDSEATRSLHLQFRLRAEAIYGLVALLTRAANNSDNDTDYQRKLEKYKVNAYIENFVINDGWQFPLRRIFPLTMDEFWLYAINTNGYRDKEPYRGFGLDKKGKLADYANIDKPNSSLWDYINKISSDEFTNTIFGCQSLFSLVMGNPNSMRADFAKIFPVHYFATPDLVEFSKVFKTNFSELDNDEIYEYTAVYWRPRGHFKDSDWQLFDSKLNSNKPAISPLDQVRVIVVLKDHADGDPNNKYDGIYPIRIQLSRTDGWDIDGPVYKKLTHSLSDVELLPDERKLGFTGKNGAVFHPFYQFGQNTIAGTKPMAGKIAMGSIDADTYYWFNGLNNMRYMYEVTVGNLTVDGRKNKTTRTVRVTGEDKNFVNYKNVNEDFTLAESRVDQIKRGAKYSYQYLVSLDVARQHQIPDVRFFKNTDPDSNEPYTVENCVFVKDEEVLLNNDFLVSRSNESEYPNLFTDRFWQADGPEIFAMMRLGGKGDYFVVDKNFQHVIDCPHNKQFDLKRDGSVLTIGKFDWKTQVEFIFVVVAQKLDINAYNNMKLDWRSIPLRIDMAEYTGLDTVGPQINMNLNFLGNVEKTQDAKSGYQYVDENARELYREGLDSELTTLQAQLNKLDKSIISICNFGSKQEEKRHIFAGYHNCSYQTLSGNNMDSLRPFGGNMPGSGGILGSYMSDTIGHRVLPKGKTCGHPFRFGFTNFQSRGKSGIEESEDEVDTEIQIVEPASYILDVPWTDTNYLANEKNPKKNPILDRWQENVVKKGENEIVKQVRKWVENDAQMIRQPSPGKIFND